nr:ATP-dependent RNA helicase DEAH11, chloroplastic-like [Ipomoea batatas]
MNDKKQGSLLSLRSDKGLGGARSGFGSDDGKIWHGGGGLGFPEKPQELRKPKALGVATDLLKTRESLLVEQVVISKKIEEFPHGIRSFPVDIEYVPCDSEGYSSVIAPYVSNIVRMVLGIHNIQRDRTILAFLTSQIEVEWAYFPKDIETTIQCLIQLGTIAQIDDVYVLIAEELQLRHGHHQFEQWLLNESDFG